MAWVDEQERLTQEARLQVASPEEVYRELKKIAEKPKYELFGRSGELEASLIERNHPLINPRVRTHKGFASLAVS